jgi:hypothetical protein
MVTEQTAAASATSIAWSSAFTTIGIAAVAAAGIALAAWAAFKLFQKVFGGPSHSPTPPEATSPPPDDSQSGQDNGFGADLAYAEQLFQQGQSLGGSQSAMQTFNDYMYRHPELYGHSPSGSFRAGTQGQYLDFGAGTPVMLHGKERVMTEAEGDRQGWGGTIIVQTLDSADFESFLRRGGARQIADALGPHLVRVLA